MTDENNVRNIFDKRKEEGKEEERTVDQLLDEAILRHKKKQDAIKEQRAIRNQHTLYTAGIQSTKKDKK